MLADDPADVQDCRPREAEMGEQQRPAPAGQVDAVVEDTKGDIRQRDAAQLGDPGSRHVQRDQSGLRRHDGMAKLGRKAIAVPGGAAAGIRLAAGRQNHPRRGKDPVRRGQRKTRFGPSQIQDRLVQGQRRAAAPQPPEQGVEDVGGCVADRKDLTGFLYLGRHALGFKQVDGVLHAQGGEGRVKEAAGGAKGFDNAVVVGGVGQVAAGAAGHQDLDTGFAILFQQERAPAAFGSAAGRQQPGGAGSDDHDIPDSVWHMASFRGT
jgi:hypothetical protein